MVRKLELLCIAIISLLAFAHSLDENLQVSCNHEILDEGVNLACVGLGFNGQAFSEEILNGTQAQADGYRIISAQLRPYTNNTRSDDPATDLEITENTFRLLPNLIKLSMGAQFPYSPNRSNTYCLKIASDEFRHTPKLRSLEINTLILTNDALMAIRSVINLEELAIGDSNFSHITQWTFQGLANLKTLSLPNCGISRLDPAAFDTFKNLTNLYLNHNHIDSIDPRIFARLTKLRILHIGTNQLVTLPPHIFKTTPQLSYLNLDYNQLENITADVFGDLNETDLRISNNRIHYIEPSALSTLKDITLTNNHISNLSNDFFANHSRLRWLFLDSNKIEKIPTDMFKGSEGVEILVFNDNEITSIESGAFDDLINLKHMHVKNNKLTSLPHGLFVHNLNLVVVYISGNNIDNLSRENFTHCRSFYQIW